MICLNGVRYPNFARTYSKLPQGRLENDNRLL